MPRLSKSQNFFIILSFLTCLSSFARVDLSEFYKHFKKGEYLKAQDIIGRIPYDEAFEGTRYYLLAITFKYLQQHDLAVPNFKKAIQLGKKSEDLFFEYGQSLFAINELEAARRAFRISYKAQFKEAYSLYYIAHISEILEDHNKVKSNYAKILKNPEAEPEIKQVAYLRLAELIYEQTKNKFYAENYIADYVVPLLNRGLAIDPESDNGKEIQSRYDEILLKQNMHPLLLENGRLLSRQGDNLFFTQSFEYDNNVTLESDSPSQTNTATDIASWYSRSDFFYSKRFVGGKHYVFTPELRLTHTHYFNRDNSQIFQNDSYSIAPALRGSYNFSWNKKRAELLFELDYNYTARDIYGIEERKFYGRSTIYSLGLRRKFFDKGDTTIKLRSRNLSSYLEELSGKTTTLYADQLWIRENGHIIIGLAIYDMYRPNSETLSTNSLLLRTDYLMPQFWQGLDLNLSGSINFLDTMEQADTRGTEKTYGLEVRLQKRWNKKWRFGVGYNYAKNTSLDEENFSYTRSLWSLEARYSFY